VALPARWAIGLAAGILVGLAHDAPPRWRLLSPTRVRYTGVFQDGRLTEASAAAASRSQSGIIWTLNDSGNDPLVFATDTLGTARGTFRPMGATNVDWEAVALGPCGRARCLYLGDTGDNAARRWSITIYRLPEPLVGAAFRNAIAAPADSLVVRYPDGPRDVEAMVVTETEEIALISKGWEGRVRLYRIPAAVRWNDPAGTVAELVDELPIPTGFWTGRLVTDAALSPRGDRLAVRTYRDLYIFRRHAPEDWIPETPDIQCEIGHLEPQGEGISWWDDRTLVLLSEQGYGRAGTIIMLECGSSSSPTLAP
jgi:hypothetical protein